MQQKTDPKDVLGISDTQWQARVDLAAAHRMAVIHGFHEGIFNHLTLAVPDTDDRYYQIPFGTHWSEVTASCFMEISFDGELLKGSGDIERSAYCNSCTHPSGGARKWRLRAAYTYALLQRIDPA